MATPRVHLRLIAVGYLVLAVAGLVLAPTVYRYRPQALAALEAYAGADIDGSDDPAMRDLPEAQTVLQTLEVGFHVICAIGVIAACTNLLAAWAFWVGRWYEFCFAVSIMGLLFVPIGTPLGVYALVILAWPQTKTLYPRRPRGETAASEYGATAGSPPRR